MPCLCICLHFANMVNSCVVICICVLRTWWHIQCSKNHILKLWIKTYFFIFVIIIALIGIRNSFQVTYEVSFGIAAMEKISSMTTGTRDFATVSRAIIKRRVFTPELAIWHASLYVLMNTFVTVLWVGRGVIT